MIEIINKSWAWTGIEPVEIIMENDFGNLIIMDKVLKYWRLCPEDLYCEVIAQNKIEYDELLLSSDFIEDWNMKLLVEEADSKYGELANNYKYMLVTSGVLGGAYDITNINVAPFDEIVELSGELAFQLKDMEDGSEIELTVID